MAAIKSSHAVISEAHEVASHEKTTAPPPTSSLPSSVCIEQVLAMAKGDGEASYSKNSEYEAELSRRTLLALDEALDAVNLSSKHSGPVVVADLGSSSGPNTIASVCHIVNKLRLRLPGDTEFQAFFDDLPSNDFNNLFRLLGDSSTGPNFFAAGVPGSFYGRLFPSSSVTVFFSSLCLQWMSKIPDAVVDKDSPAYNRKNPWITNSSSAVATSFQQQSSSDLKTFLLARAAELVQGGLLFVSFVARASSDPTEPTADSINNSSDNLQEIWRDLIVEGVLTEEQLDAFNLPVFKRSIEEVREGIASAGSLFDVHAVELHSYDTDAMSLFGTSDAKIVAKKMTGFILVLIGGLLEAHVGKKAMKTISQRYENLVEKKIRMNPEYARFTNTICTMSLIRK